MKEPKRTVQRVATGTTIETHSDAMSTETMITIEFPLGGTFISAEELKKVFEDNPGSKPRTLSDVRELVGSSDTETSQEVTPLSKSGFYKRARQLLDQIAEVLTRIPEDDAEPVERALNMAFQVGGIIATERLRSRHLAEVEREAISQPARKRGGDLRRGKFKADTPLILSEMDRLVGDGLSLRSASEIVSRRKDVSAEAIRKRYRVHRPKSGSNQS